MNHRKRRADLWAGVYAGLFETEEPVEDAADEGASGSR